MALVACVPPKAAVVAPPPVVEKKEKKAPEPVVAMEPAVPELPDDGFRMPDMLELPTDGEFRATNPGSQTTGVEAGAVISRPPTDPPSRVKPKPAE